MTTGTKRQTINTMAEKKFRRARNTPFDWHEFDGLAGLGASQEYAAERMLIKEGAPVNKTTVETTIKWICRAIHKQYGMTYVQYCNKRQERFTMALKQRMRKTAIEDNNVTMQIWLSKQYLGYSEKVEAKEEVKAQTKITYETKWGSATEPTDKDPAE